MNRKFDACAKVSKKLYRSDVSEACCRDLTSVLDTRGRAGRIFFWSRALAVNAVTSCDLEAHRSKIHMRYVLADGVF